MDFIFFIFLSNFVFFLRILDEILSGFRDKFQKRVTCVAFSIKLAKTHQKIAENSEICENYLILLNIIQSCPYREVHGEEGPGPGEEGRAEEGAGQKTQAGPRRCEGDPGEECGAPPLGRER